MLNPYDLILPIASPRAILSRRAQGIGIPPLPSSTPLPPAPSSFFFGDAREHSALLFRSLVEK
jgi:hypothetical protein